MKLEALAVVEPEDFQEKKTRSRSAAEQREGLHPTLQSWWQAQQAAPRCRHRLHPLEWASASLGSWPALVEVA